MCSHSKRAVCLDKSSAMRAWRAMVVAAAVTTLMTAPSVTNAMPSYVGSVLSGIELSIPTGDDAEESQLERGDDELRVQDRIRLVLRQMGTTKQDNSDSIADDTPALRDPLPLEDWEQHAAGVSVYLSHMSLSGMSDYTVGAVIANLASHEFAYRLHFRRLSVVARFRLDHYWAQHSGHVLVTLDGATAHTRGLLHVDANGTVQPLATHAHTTLVYTSSTADVDSGGGGLVNALAQAAITTLAPYLTDLVQTASMPPIVAHVARHTSIYVRRLDDTAAAAAAGDLTDGDAAEAAGGPLVFIDAAIRQMRQQIRDAGYDPLPLPGFVQPLAGGLRLALTNGSLVGLSSLRRAGHVRFAPARTTVEATLTLGTGRVAGRYRWSLEGGGGIAAPAAAHKLMQRAGFVQFSVDGVRLCAQLTHQDGRPRLDQLDVQVGGVSVRSEGAGSVDYLLNVGTDRLATHIKTLLTSAIKTPLHWIINRQTSMLPNVW